MNKEIEKEYKKNFEMIIDVKVFSFGGEDLTAKASFVEVHSVWNTRDYERS